jgi:soluble cytochrome b562
VVQIEEYITNKKEIIKLRKEGKKTEAEILSKINDIKEMRARPSPDELHKYFHNREADDMQEELDMYIMENDIIQLRKEGKIEQAEVERKELVTKAEAYRKKLKERNTPSDDSKAHPYLQIVGQYMRPSYFDRGGKKKSQKRFSKRLNKRNRSKKNKI